MTEHTEGPGVPRRTGDDGLPGHTWQEPPPVIDLFSAPADLAAVGDRLVAAAGWRWTSCNEIIATSDGVQVDLTYRGQPHQVSVDSTGAIHGIPDLPAFRRAAVEMHLAAAAELGR